ncbi:MAG TPA: MarP family serine protease [Candidatus Limnocylindrales bacterium]|nr:MarP family serine protease [Candidatus Limnocylindrales bacterium]
MIAVAVLFALVSGFRRGFWLSLGQYLGLLIGVIAGAAIAPPVLDRLQVQSPDARSVGAIVILVIAGALGSTIGYWAGEPIRMRLLARPGGGRWDSTLGALFSAVAVLSVSWFLGLSFDGSALGPAIQRSWILRSLDAIAPRPPPFLSRVQAILSGVRFPSAFSGFEPFFQQSYPVPASVDTPGVRAAEAATVKVAGRGCGGIVYGSGFPVGPGRFLTNAHVVAGTRNTTIVAGGNEYGARVILFDPETDVAILYAPGLRLSPLPMAAAGPGTQGAAIGYPEGDGEKVSPAVIDQEVEAQGRDIYGQNLVTRQIWVTQADVVPGNSGGPLVDLQGRVLGVIFAASTSQPGQSYALTDDEIQPDLQAAQGRSQAVPVGGCAL